MFQQDVKEVIRLSIRTKKPAIILGPPGCGKSEIAAEVADEEFGPPEIEEVFTQYGVIEKKIRPYYHVEHLATYGPTDLVGQPYVDASGLHYDKPKWIPPHHDTVEEGLILLDEFAHMTGMTMNAAMRVVHEKQAGEHKLRGGWAMIAASNRVEDKAGSGKIHTAMWARFPIKVTMEVDTDPTSERGFRRWAIDQGWNPLITSYFAYQPQDIMDFDPNVIASPSCRSWSQVNDILPHIPVTNVEIYSGIIGEGRAAKFSGFVRLHDKVVPPADIIANPKGVPMPKQPDMVYATMGALIHFLKDKTGVELEKAVEWGQRLGQDFAMVFARDLFAGHKMVMLKMPAMQKWVMDNKHLLL